MTLHGHRASYSEEGNTGGTAKPDQASNSPYSALHAKHPKDMKTSCL